MKWKGRQDLPIKKKLSIVDPKTGQVVETDAVVYP